MTITAGMLLTLLLICSLATARVTRLIVTDEISVPLRRLAFRLDKNSRHVGYIVTCPYCTGVWAAAGVVGLVCIAIEADGWGRWLAAAPIAIMAVAQAALWLTPREVETASNAYMAPWPKGD
jgi:hypothetical protein